MVAGSEVPNLLEPGAAASLVVSQDVDLAVALEKLVTDRTRDKGDRDLLVFAGLLRFMTEIDQDELVIRCLGLANSPAGITSRVSRRRCPACLPWRC